ncbi:NB-ARC domain-containing protein, partial [Staphylococcus capitis]|uniref:NB-ARC domain-containing protein n=1 Tax=Staphylococcus capitis TaxID=29388 RepID=UPI003CFD9767
TPGQRPVDPHTALEILLRMAGVGADAIPAPHQERIAIWRTHMVGKRFLVLLDNAADANQLRPLLPGPDNVVVVTSRRRVVGLEDTLYLSLNELTDPESLRLFTTLVGPRAAAEPDEAAKVVELCSRVPLAIRIAAARLIHRPRWTVAHLAERLNDHRRRLGELSDGDQGITPVLELSYLQLDPEQQRMFTLLGIHPGPDVDLYSAAALAGIDTESADLILEELLDVNLLMQHSVSRYTLHDLTRQYCRNKLCDLKISVDAALQRLAEYYRDMAAVSSSIIFPSNPTNQSTPPDPSGSIPPLADRNQAMRWLAENRRNLVAMAEQGTGKHACDLSRYLRDYLDLAAHYSDAVTLHRAALHTADREGDLLAKADALTALGSAASRAGNYTQALDYHRQALD